MVLDDLIRNPAAWLSSDNLTGIVVSSRIRLARNIEGLAFPGWAGDDECARIQARVWIVLKGIQRLAPSLALDMASLTPVDREFLSERHLISQELAQKSHGSGVVIRSDEGLSVMVNEEDHLRLQALRPGLQLEALWAEINALDSELEQHVRFAFSPSLGYLTACPTNVGTGLRASAMLHVPGLRLINEIDPIIKGLTKIGLAVRGLQGEGTEAIGNMFQISNQTTLGESESVIIDRLIRIVSEVAQHEANARARLLETREAYVEDFVGRAYGVLCYANVLNSRETLDMLSALRLGCELGMITGIKVADVNRLLLYTLPGHLQKTEGRLIPPDERDHVRARLVRETVRRASI
ncbi:MAG: protein arginine kinase [bacterium]